MEINDIIGIHFLPPFCTHRGNSPYILDARGSLVATVDFEALDEEEFTRRQSIRSTLAQHICDLLNREHSEYITPDNENQ